MPLEPTLTIRSHARMGWKVVAATVTAASLIWVLLLLARAWPALAARADEIQIPFLAGGFVLSVVSAFLTFEVFVLLARAFKIRTLRRSELAHLYFTAQLLKHLPGRIWGVGYQWMSGNAAGSLSDWVFANLSHMGMASFFALWSSWLVLGFTRGSEWGFLAFVGGIVIYWTGWYLLALPALQRGTAWVLRLSGRSGLHVVPEWASVPPSTRSRIFLLFCASWALYYLAWILYGASYPSLGAASGMKLCAYYMLAWFIGYVSLVTPSGLGVRELVFAWLAKDFGGDSVALMAIVGRISLLAVDVVLGLLFAPFAPRRNAIGGQSS